MIVIENENNDAKTDSNFSLKISKQKIDNVKNNNLDSTENTPNKLKFKQNSPKESTNQKVSSLVVSKSDVKKKIKKKKKLKKLFAVKSKKLYQKQDKNDIFPNVFVENNENIDEHNEHVWKNVFLGNKRNLQNNIINSTIKIIKHKNFSMRNKNIQKIDKNDKYIKAYFDLKDQLKEKIFKDFENDISKHISKYFIEKMHNISKKNGILNSCIACNNRGKKYKTNYWGDKCNLAMHPECFMFYHETFVYNDS